MKDESKDVAKRDAALRDNLLNFVMYGFDSKDSMGRGEVISVRVRADVNDYWEQIISMSPANWFKNQGALKRCCMSVGMVAILDLLKNRTKLSERNQVKAEALITGLNKMNWIATKHRATMLDKEYDDLRKEIMHGDHPLKKDMANVIVTIHDLVSSLQFD